MKKYDAVIAGYTCVDLIPRFNRSEIYTDISDLLKPGKLIEIDSMDYVLGGAVPNTGLAMKKFNKKVFLNGLIGDDFIGMIAKEYLGKFGVSEGIVSTAKSSTAFSIVLAPPGVDRIFLESPGCNRIFDISHINFNVISESRVFHFGYPPLLRQFFENQGRQLSEMYSKIQQLGVVTSLDLSLPDPQSESGKINWTEIMEKTLPYVDIFVPSLEEALQIMMPDKYKEILSADDSSNINDMVPLSLVRELGKIIIDAGVKILLIKAGERGAYLLTNDISSINKKLEFIMPDIEWNHLECWCNAYPASLSKVVNASGAGDTAAAGFISAILDGEKPDMAIKYATMAGRNNLYCYNIFSDLTDWKRMSEEIHKEPNEIIFFETN